MDDYIEPKTICPFGRAFYFESDRSDLFDRNGNITLDRPTLEHYGLVEKLALIQHIDDD